MNFPSLFGAIFFTFPVLLPNSTNSQFFDDVLTPNSLLQSQLTVSLVLSSFSIQSLPSYIRLLSSVSSSPPLEVFHLRFFFAEKPPSQITPFRFPSSLVSFPGLPTFFSAPSTSTISIELLFYLFLRNGKGLCRPVRLASAFRVGF